MLSYRAVLSGLDGDQGRAVRFLDSQRGCLTAGDDVVPSRGDGIWYTTHGGAHWTAVAPP